MRKALTAHLFRGTRFRGRVETCARRAQLLRTMSCRLFFLYFHALLSLGEPPIHANLASQDYAVYAQHWNEDGPRGRNEDGPRGREASVHVPGHA